MTWFLTAVRHEVNNLESSVVVQELEFAINRALYGLLWSLGNQYIVGSPSWRSLTHTETFPAQKKKKKKRNWRVQDPGCNWSAWRRGRQRRGWEDTKGWTGIEFWDSIRAAEDRERWKVMWDASTTVKDQVICNSIYSSTSENQTLSIPNLSENRTSSLARN